MKKTLSLVLVVLMLAFVFMLETPTASINKNYVHFYSDMDATNEVNNNLEEIDGAPILEYRLEDTSIDGGFLIEMYREYEIYKNQNDDIVKIVPTDHTEYLHYAKQQ